MIPIPSVAEAPAGRIVLAMLLAMIPALVAWWTGRRLLRNGEDPALPELLDSRRRTTIKAVAVALALMIVFAGNVAAWGMPLLVVLLLASGYPVRTRVLGETWGFGSYLWYTVLSVVGGFGFWIALAYAPTIVHTLLRAAGAAQWWWVGIVVAAALIAWEAWYPRIWLWAHAAKPLTRPELIPRFEAIVQRAGTVSPAVYSVGPKGSRFVNAVALPSMKRPAVAMGDALLDLLDPDESAAIFAHEIAHFDHLNPRWIRRSQLVNRLLIIVGVALPIVTTFFAPTLTSSIGWLWVIGVLFALAHRTSKSQQHETESDLRAAALSGDPDALVRALAKLHFHARVPRRWAVDVERVASHPSLVRRIQAIRAGGAAAAEQLGAATVVRSPREGSWVVLDDARAYWLDGVASGTRAELAALRDAASSYRAVNYQDLAELRVAAAGGDRTLHARTRAGDAWTVPIVADDVARVQQALDIVDVRLGRVSASAGPGMAKFLGVMALAVAIVAGQSGIVFVAAVLAVWKPGPASLAALGAMSLVRAAFGFIEGSDNWFASTEVIALATVVLATLGVVCIVSAIRQVGSGATSAHYRFTLAVLGAVAAIVALTAASGIWQSQPVTASSVIGAPVLATLGTILFGLAAVLLTSSAPRGRRAGTGLVVAATATAALGIDPASFSLRNALVETTAQATSAGQSVLAGVATGLHVAPNGERFLAMRYPTGRRTPANWTPTLSVGRVGGPLREMPAFAGDFVDDNRILVLAQLEHGLELRLERADTLAPALWADTLSDPEVNDPRLIIDRDASMWSVVGVAADTDATVLVSGRIGQKGTARRVAMPDTLPSMGEPIIFGTTNTVVAPVMARGTLRGSASLAPLAMLGGGPLRMEFWRVSGSGVGRVGTIRGVPQCGEPLGGAAACVVRERSAVALHTVMADGGTAEVARLSGVALGATAVGPGLRASSVTFDREVVLVDLATRRLTRVTLGADSAAYVSEVRSGPGYVVTLSQSGEGGSVVRRYLIR
jgi:Zn-dependent protease with chaperone function